MTALYLAASLGYEAVVGVLGEKANVNEIDYLGKSALHLATTWEHKAVVSMLFKMGADIDAKDGMGQTALFIAELWKYEEILDILKNGGAVVSGYEEQESDAIYMGHYFN
jgi:ankyrin repeat protein